MYKWVWQAEVDRYTDTQSLVGCVSSGDLEILFKPDNRGVLEVHICTSAGNDEERWQQLLKRFLQRHVMPSGVIKMNDFGATPGVIQLRLEQLLEKL